MHVRAKQNAVAGAANNIDMRIYAALADQLQFRQPIQQSPRDAGPFADKHESFSLSQTVCKDIFVIDMIIPYFYVMIAKFSETRKMTKRIVPVVEDCDFHSRDASRSLPASVSSTLWPSR